jgi:hypothetical protein
VPPPGEVQVVMRQPSMAQAPVQAPRRPVADPVVESAEV